MSINSILNIATSGLYASQSGIGAVSKNISNVNTKGYVRIEQEQSAMVIGGRNAGVSVNALRRAVDGFLQSASLSANSNAQSQGAKSQYLDELQSAFGDPSGASSLFGRINSTLGAFETAIANPGSISVRRDILAQLQGVLSQISNVANSVQMTRSRVDTDIEATIGEINTLLKDISDVNTDVSRSILSGDATGAQERQSQLIDELSSLIDISVSYNENGVANITTKDGAFLAGFGHATIEYTAAPSGQPYYNNIVIKMGDDPVGRQFEQSVQGGKLRGLLDLRNNDLGEIAATLGEFAGHLTDAINAVHNTTASLPALANAIGSDTGLIASDALGFSGRTTIGIVGANGALARKIDIDFSLGTISVDGGAASPIGTTIGSMTAALNGALAGLGSASFANGKLSLQNSVAGNGFVFDEPTSNGSLRGDKAFAHFFGLNNLINSNLPTSFATGLSATDAHGFTVGDTLELSFSAPSGLKLAARTITIPAGTIGDILTALNSPATGLGLYGNFALSSNGTLQWNANPGYESHNIELSKDTDPRSGTSLSFGQLTGLSPNTRAARATAIGINSNIASDPRKLGLALPDLSSVAIGEIAVGLGDSLGAQAFFDINNMRMDFSNKFGQFAGNMTLGEFASSLAGDIGMRAATAENEKAAAEALMQEATTRRSNSEGVNLDEELVKLTAFQQAYSASARMIRAADEMYETLLNAV